MIIGKVKGEVCNRNGCCGVIDEHEKDGCCSCHISPPCDYCTTDAGFCPECGCETADPYDEFLQEYMKENPPFSGPYPNYDEWLKQRKAKNK